MALHPNVERFRNAFTARGQASLTGNATAVEDVLADDVVWNGSSGNGNGRSAAVDAWTAFGKDGIDARVDEVYADDVHVAAVLEYSSGKGPNVRQVNVVHLDDDGKRPRSGACRRTSRSPRRSPPGRLPQTIRSSRASRTRSAREHVPRSARKTWRSSTTSSWRTSSGTAAAGPSGTSTPRASPR